MTFDPYHRSYFHAGKTLELVIIRSKRKTLALHVLPGGQPAEARVPLKCAWADIEAFINERLDWWVKAQGQLVDLPEPPKFVHGERHEILGEAIYLDVKRAYRNSAALEGGKLAIQSQDPSCSKTNQGIFFDFVKAQSKALFPVRLAQCVADFPIPVKPTGLRIRRMKARWGSCSHTGEICLNSLLVQKDIQAIDLVIAHELCHLKHFHHNADFYALLDEAMPDWKQRERLLTPLHVREGDGQAGSGKRTGKQLDSDGSANENEQTDFIDLKHRNKGSLGQLPLF